jgi:hypothetical protein
MPEPGRGSNGTFIVRVPAELLRLQLAIVRAHFDASGADRTGP